MEMLSTVWEWVYTNILGNAAMFLAILVLVGQLLSSRTAVESARGALSCFIGFNVFFLATNGLSATFRPILLALKDKFGIDITVNEGYYGMAAMQTRFLELGGNLGLQGIVMGVGFGITILLSIFRKYTKIRALTVQGHALTNGAFKTLMLVYCAYPYVNTAVLILLAGALLAFKMSVYCNLSVEPAQDLTDGAGMAVGHAQMIGDRIAWEVGKKIERRSIRKTGKKPKKLDEIKFPSWLGIFDDSNVACFIVMFLFFGVIIMILGRDTIAAIDTGFLPGDSFFIYIVEKSMMFPVYLVILFAGMKIFVAEIMGAFEGLSKKVLKGTLSGLDAAAFYGFAGNQNVITMGFLIGTVVMICCTLIGVALNLPFIVMMGFVPMMFDNATVAMFGHHRGGIKGLIFGAVMCGVVDVFLGGLSAYWLGYIEYHGVAAQFDDAVTHGLTGWIMNYGVWGLVVVILLIAAIPQLQYYLSKDREAYWMVAEDYPAYKERVKEKEEERLAKKS